MPGFRTRIPRPSPMHKLVLIRHGESTWNQENRFTGWTDVDLTPTGIEQAKTSGRLLKAFSHAQTRPDPPRRIDLEPGKPLHRLDRCRPDAHRHRTGQDLRPPAQGRR